GVVSIDHSAALGTTDGATFVHSGGVLRIAQPLPIAETLHLAGGGVGAGALDVENDVTWTGDVFLDDSATIFAGLGDALTITGRVRGSLSLGTNPPRVIETGHTLTKLGDGTLTFAGSVANTNTGLTRVLEGQLRLNRSVANGAIV